jgi:hypothetical protein
MKSKAPKDTEKEKKPDASLIPLDLLIDFLVPAYEEGLIKYYRDSWREGFTTTHMIGGLLRHLSSYEEGEDYDPDTLERFDIKKHHLGAMIFCVLCMCDTFKNHPELDDRRHLIKKEQETNNFDPDPLVIEQLKFQKEQK